MILERNQLSAIEWDYKIGWLIDLFLTTCLFFNDYIKLVKKMKCYETLIPLKYFLCVIIYNYFIVDYLAFECH